MENKNVESICPANRLYFRYLLKRYQGLTLAMIALLRSAQFAVRTQTSDAAHPGLAASTVPMLIGRSTDEQTVKHPPRVLIVDDEPAIAELISVNLKHGGFAPSWVEDGASAQRKIDEELPDIVLLDWELPGESGLSLVQQWRTQQRTAVLPIVMLTARGSQWDKIAALEAGADDYVTKPFSPQELLKRIRAVMRHKAQNPSSDLESFNTLVHNAAMQC